MTYGLDTGPLPEDWQPVEAVAIVKCFADDDTGAGAVKLATRGTESLNIWEAVGMLDCARADLLDQYKSTLEG